MQETSIYLLAELLLNQNLRTYEATNTFLIFTVFAYFFFVVTTAYLVRTLSIAARIITTFFAIFLNLILALSIQGQAAIGKVLLNTLSKLALDGQAPIFKETLIEQGVTPGSDLSTLDPFLLKLFLIILFVIGVIAPVYLYIFANWERD